MNLTAKIKKLEREIEALWKSLPAVKVDPDEPAVVAGFPTDAALPKLTGPVQVYEDTSPLAVLSRPKRRGRPPKVTNGN